MDRKKDTTLLTIGQGAYGEIQIADEVFHVIAGYAATEVEGVHAISGNITGKLLPKTGIGMLSKGVRVRIDDRDVRIDLVLIIDGGYNIPKVCEAVQDRVKNAVENMTGFTVSNVNIRIIGVEINDGLEN